MPSSSSDAITLESPQPPGTALLAFWLIRFNVEHFSGFLERLFSPSRPAARGTGSGCDRSRPTQTNITLPSRSVEHLSIRVGFAKKVGPDRAGSAGKSELRPSEGTWREQSPFRRFGHFQGLFRGENNVESQKYSWRRSRPLPCRHQQTCRWLNIRVRRSSSKHRRLRRR
jgi:hypothetical protein